MLITAELLQLLPVGFCVTNGNGVKVSRISEVEWECVVSGMKRIALTAEKAANLVEQMRSI